MKFGNLDEITGSEIKSWYEDLVKIPGGCYAVCFNSDSKNNYAVCMGHHDDGVMKIAWKIGRQAWNSCMQCDFDLDFEMPCFNDSGEVDDTFFVFDEPPKSMVRWEAVAAEMRREADRVWKTHGIPDGE